MLHIKTPASTSNFGSGFDCIGMAFKLYNNLWVERTDGAKLNIDTELKGIRARNLIYKTILNFYKITGTSNQVPSLKLRQEDHIPKTRGLGSSAACIVSGLLAANELSNAKMQMNDLAFLAAKMEGHPDNSTPALVGGVVVGALQENKLDYIKLNTVHLKKLKFFIMIPNFELSTKQLRAVLPNKYSRADAVFNLSRSALLVGALTSGRFDMLMTATEDKIHQEYRMKNIPNMGDIFEKSKQLGASCVFLSGAGPTIIAIVEEHEKAFGNRMTAYLKTISNHWRLSILSPDLEGAKVEVEE